MTWHEREEQGKARRWTRRTWCGLVTASAVALTLGALAFPGAAQTPAPGAKKMLGEQPTRGKQQKQPQLKKPRDPEAMALFLHLLDRFARNVPQKSEMDMRLERGLGKKPGSREAVGRLLARFWKIPAEQRRDLLGKHGPIAPEIKVPKDRYLAAFRRAAKARKPVPKLERDAYEPEEKLPGKQPERVRPKKPGARPASLDRASLAMLPAREPAPAADTLPGIEVAELTSDPAEYRLTYTGLRCKEEAFYDGGSTQDEIYVIVSVLDSDRHKWVSKHPHGTAPDRVYGQHSTYQDLDSGNVREGPNRNCWHSNEGAGGARDLTLVVWVWEQDFGDPEDTKEATDAVIEAARDACGDCPEWLEFVLDVLEFLVDNIFSFGDDLIERVERRIDAEDIPLYVEEADRAPRLRRFEHDDKVLRYHFRTRHNAHEGADYRVTFRFNPE